MSTDGLIHHHLDTNVQLGTKLNVGVDHELDSLAVDPLTMAHEALCNMVDRLPIAIAQWRKGLLHYCNDEFLTLTGKTSSQLDHIDQFTALMNPAGREAERQGNFRIHYRLQNHAGQWIDIWEFGQCNQDFWNCCFVNISEWAKIEQQSRRLDATLDGVMSVSSVPMIELSTPELRVVRHNHAALSMFGDELPGQLISQLLPYGQAAQVSTDCHRALETDQETPLTCMVLNPPSGSHLFVRGACRSVTFGDTHRVILWVEDVSEQHKAVQQQQIRQINDQFSQEMTALLLSDRYEFASSRVCARLGAYLNVSGVAWYWPREQHYQRDARWFQGNIPPERIQWECEARNNSFHLADHIPAQLDDFNAQAMMVSRITQADGTNGLLLVWSDHSRTWTDEEATLLSQLGNSIALARQHHQLILARENASRDAIIQARQRAERLAEQSRNLRTPLASLLGLLDVSEQLPNESAFPLIRNSSERLLNLLQEFSDQEQLRSGDIFLNERQATFSKLITREVQLYEDRLVTSQQQLSIQFSGDTNLKFLIDIDRFRTLLQAVLELSLQYQSNVIIECHINDDHCLLCVKGLPVGLSIDSLTKPSLVLKGQVAFDNQSLTVFLPLSKSSVPISTTSQRAPVSKDCCIMVVEDDATSREYLRLILESMQYTFIGVTNGQEALELLTSLEADQKPMPNLILMDCLMPVMDGYEATRVIRQSTSSFAETPIVALTAQAMAGDRERCLAAGMTAYLSKPVSRSDFTEVINDLLQPLPS